MKDSQLAYDDKSGGWGLQDVVKVDLAQNKLSQQDGLNSLNIEEEKKQPRKDSGDQHIDQMIKNEDNLFDLAKSYEEVKEAQKSLYRVYVIE